MVRFSDSDKYSLVEKSECEELVSYINYYAHLFYGSSYELVKLPNGNIGIRARVSLQAGSNSPLIQHEPIVIEIDGDEVEGATIHVYPDRLNFPFDLFPHINHAIGELPASLCLTRESFDNWYAENSFGDLIALIHQWFDDALNGNLIKTDKGDFYEPFRIDNAEKFLFKVPIEDSYLENMANTGTIGYTVYRHDNSFYSRYCLNPDKTRKDIGVLLFRDSSLICKTWFVEQPKTLGALYKFASENGFVIDKKVIEKHITDNQEEPESIFFQFAFIRPAKVLGKETRVDYLMFCMNLSDYRSDNADGKVSRVQMIDFATTKLANYISNTSSTIADKRILILGCGAIGSKLIYHLYRSGICNLTICDNDTFNSHNVCRHVIVKHGLWDKKVKLIKKELDAMFMCNDTQVSVVDEDIIKWLPTTDLSNYDLIIDATASASVFRLIDQMSIGLPCPIIHFALSDAGNIGHVYVRTKQDAALSDYYMVLASKSIEDEDISSWIKNESKYNLDRVRIGEGCHSNTMRLGDEIISTHTGIAASIVKSILTKGSHNMAFLSFANVEYEGQVFTEKIEIPCFKQLFCNDCKDWQVRIPEPLLNKIQLEAKLAGKKEVGGYLMGNVDKKHKVIYVLHQFKPSDSKQKDVKLRLGTKGWREEYLKVKKASSGMLEYIGDWHSHPFGSLDMSIIDILTNYAIKTEEIPVDYGLCLITNSHRTEAHILQPGIEVYIVKD